MLGEKQSDQHSNITKIGQDLLDYLSFRSIREKKQLIKLFEKETGSKAGSMIMDVYAHGIMRLFALLGAGTSVGINYLDPKAPLRMQLTMAGVSAAYFGMDYMMSKIHTLDTLTARLYNSSKGFRFGSSPYYHSHTDNTRYEETVPRIESKTLSAEEARTILGVNRQSSYRDIKRAYRRIALKTHPDIVKDNPASTEKFRKASEAYGLLEELYKMNDKK